MTTATETMKARADRSIGKLNSGDFYCSMPGWTEFRSPGVLDREGRPNQIMGSLHRAAPDIR